MAGEQLQDPDADWDREDAPQYVDVEWRMKATGRSVGADYAARNPGLVERVEKDAPVDVVIPTEDVLAALADPKTEALYPGPAAKLLIVLSQHFAGEYTGERPTLIVRKP